MDVCLPRQEQDLLFCSVLQSVATDVCTLWALRCTGPGHWGASAQNHDEFFTQ